MARRFYLLFCSTLWANIFTFTMATNWTTESLLPPRTCRTVLRGQAYRCPEADFAKFTCLSCYLYLPDHVIPKEKKFKLCNDLLPGTCNLQLCKPVMLENGTKIYQPLAPQDYDLNNPSSSILKTFDFDSDRDLWRICCENAVQCCTFMNSKPPATENNTCPRTWDSWQCFDDTKAGHTYSVVCPIYMYLRAEVPACPVSFERPCEEPGRWSSYPGNLYREWTNYSVCHEEYLFSRRHYTHIAAYAVSLLALAPAIIIFFAYKQLRVPRITMHKNLFISIFLTGVVFIIFKRVVIVEALENQDNMAREDSPWCKLLYLLTKYFRTTNYMWMFCESFYLHKLIVTAFAEQKHLYMYYILGWGFPLVPVIVYTVIRLTIPGTDTRCWLAPMGSLEWVVNGPNLVSLMANFLFLCNIIRVLVTKLRATHTSESSQYRKAVRATLVLVPLFGLHFVFTLYKPITGPCEWREAYYYINYLLDGLQGFLVALIFCYLNGEVHYLLRRTKQRWNLRRHPSARSRQSTSTQMTQVTSASDSPRQRSDSSDQLTSLELKQNGICKSQ